MNLIPFLFWFSRYFIKVIMGVINGQIKTWKQVYRYQKITRLSSVFIFHIALVGLLHSLTFWWIFLAFCTEEPLSFRCTSFYVCSFAHHFFVFSFRIYLITSFYLLGTNFIHPLIAPTLFLKISFSYSKNCLSVGVIFQYDFLKKRNLNFGLKDLSKGMWLAITGNYMFSPGGQLHMTPV